MCVFLLISCIFLGMSPHDKTFLCFWGKCKIKYVYIKKKKKKKRPLLLLRHIGSVTMATAIAFIVLRSFFLTETAQIIA